MEDKPACWRDGFDLLGERLEVYLALFQLRDEADEIGQIAPEPVESPDDEGVSLTQAFEAAFQLRPAGVLSAGLFFVHLSAFGADPTTLSLGAIWRDIARRWILTGQNLLVVAKHIAIESAFETNFRTRVWPISGGSPVFMPFGEAPKAGAS